MMNVSLRHPLLPHFGARLASAVGMAAALLAPSVQAQGFPDHVIKIIVPYTPGTGPDAVARVIAEKLSQEISQPVFVDNKAGASGNIGAREVAKSAPDGYTLMLASNSMITAALMSEGVALDLTKDFTPIARVTNGALMLVAGPSTDIKDMKELVAEAKREPGKLRFSSPGIGSLHHMAAERVEGSAGMRMMHVPYKGTAGAVTDVIGGHVDISVLGASVAMPSVKAGRLTALAVTSPERYAGAPDVPTLREAGINNADTQMWFAVMGPKNMPDPVVARLNKDIATVLQQPDVKAMLAVQGFEPAMSTPRELAESIASETAQWSRMIQTQNISKE
jgi:tripartite-type tricarboxylate transporter receptor subunit TctC